MQEHEESALKRILTTIGVPHEKLTMGQRASLSSSAGQNTVIDYSHEAVEGFEFSRSDLEGVFQVYQSHISPAIASTHQVTDGSQPLPEVNASNKVQTVSDSVPTTAQVSSSSEWSL
jgi:hypothetical protein